MQVTCCHLNCGLLVMCHLLIKIARKSIASAVNRALVAYDLISAALFCFKVQLSRGKELTECRDKDVDGLVFGGKS